MILAQTSQKELSPVCKSQCACKQKNKLLKNIKSARSIITLQSKKNVYTYGYLACNNM